MAASLLLSLLVLLSVCWTPQGMLLGGQTPIQKLDDPEVTKAASFAVQALNKDTSSTSEDNLIVLVSVEKGTMQVCFTYIKKALNYACSTLLSSWYHLCMVAQPIAPCRWWLEWGIALFSEWACLVPARRAPTCTRVLCPTVQSIKAQWVCVCVCPKMSVCVYTVCVCVYTVCCCLCAPTVTQWGRQSLQATCVCVLCVCVLTVLYVQVTEVLADVWKKLTNPPTYVLNHLKPYTEH